MAITVEKKIKKAMILPAGKISVREEWEFTDSIDGVVGGKRVIRYFSPADNTVQQAQNYVDQADVTDEIGLVAVVTAVPHPTKGERLVVLHVQEIPDISFVCRQLADRGLPNLWIPAVDSFSMIDQLPLLGSGLRARPTT